MPIALDPTLSDAVTRWLTAFEHALAAADGTALAALFAPDAHWRDLLALTWNITPSAACSRWSARCCSTVPVQRRVVLKARPRTRLHARPGWRSICNARRHAG